MGANWAVLMANELVALLDTLLEDLGVENSVDLMANALVECLVAMLVGELVFWDARVVI